MNVMGVLMTLRNVDYIRDIFKILLIWIFERSAAGDFRKERNLFDSECIIKEMGRTVCYCKGGQTASAE